MQAPSPHLLPTRWLCQGCHNLFIIRNVLASMLWDHVLNQEAVQVYGIVLQCHCSEMKTCILHQDTLSIMMYIEISIEDKAARSCRGWSRAQTKRLGWGPRKSSVKHIVQTPRMQFVLLVSFNSPEIWSPQWPKQSCLWWEATNHRAWWTGRPKPSCCHAELVVPAWTPNLVWPAMGMLVRFLHPTYAWGSCYLLR